MEIGDAIDVWKKELRSTTLLNREWRWTISVIRDMSENGVVELVIKYVSITKWWEDGRGIPNMTGYIDVPTIYLGGIWKHKSNL